MTIAEFKRLRNKYKIQMIDLAAATGLPAGYLNQIESETVRPLAHDLTRIKNGLNSIIRSIREDADEFVSGAVPDSNEKNFSV